MSDKYTALFSVAVSPYFELTPGTLFGPNPSPGCVAKQDGSALLVPLNKLDSSDLEELKKSVLERVEDLFRAVSNNLVG